MNKKLPKARAAEKITAGLKKALEHAPTYRKEYNDGVADGRLAMQSEVDESLISGLVAVLNNSKSMGPVLVSHVTVEAVARFWRKHREQKVTMHWRVVPTSDAENSADQ